MPFLELAAYAGYPFAAACASLVAQLVTGRRLRLWAGGLADWQRIAVLSRDPSLPSKIPRRPELEPALFRDPSVPASPLPAGGGTTYHAVWAYGSLCAAVFLVRTMKRVIFQEARTYSECGCSGGSVSVLQLGAVVSSPSCPCNAPTAPARCPLQASTAPATTTCCWGWPSCSSR